MNIVTSISPNHNLFNQQIIAIESWIRLGFNIYSINHESEIENLKYNFNKVHFINTKNTMYSIFNKHLISIDEIFELFKSFKEDIVFIINSDIELLNDKKKIFRMMELAMNGICLVSRYNYESDKSINSIERFGLDIFCFNKKFIDLIPKSNFTLGRPLFDYWIPYNLCKNNIPIYSIHDKIAFHKNHPKQWNKEDWRKMAVDFRRFDELKNVEEKRLSPTIRTTIINNICQTIQNL